MRDLIKESELSPDKVRRIVRRMEKEGEVTVTNDKRHHNRITFTAADGDKIRAAIVEEKKLSSLPDPPPPPTAPDPPKKEVKSVKDLAEIPGSRKREPAVKKKEEKKQEGKKEGVNLSKNSLLYIGGAALLVIGWIWARKQKQPQPQQISAPIQNPQPGSQQPTEEELIAKWAKDFKKG